MHIRHNTAFVSCAVCLGPKVVAQLQCSRVRAIPVYMQVVELGGELAAALASLGLLDGVLAVALEWRTLLEEEVVYTPQQLVLIM